jgi:hypothetical protein
VRVADICFPLLPACPDMPGRQGNWPDLGTEHPDSAVQHASRAVWGRGPVALCTAGAGRAWRPKMVQGILAGPGPFHVVVTDPGFEPWEG